MIVRILTSLSAHAEGLTQTRTQRGLSKQTQRRISYGTKSFVTKVDFFSYLTILSEKHISERHGKSCMTCTIKETVLSLFTSFRSCHGTPIH